MKHWVHLGIALSMWVATLALLGVVNKDWRSGRLDSISAYQLKKQPPKYSDSRGTVLKLFDDIGWETEPCMAKTMFNGTGDRDCYVKRTDIVTKTRAEMGCTNNRSPSCNCLTLVLRALADDNSTNILPGGFNGFGLNVQGARRNLTAALEECRWLHRNPFVADKPSGLTVRRVGLLFYLTTLTTFNLVDQSFMYLITPGFSEAGVAYSRGVLGLVAALLGLLVNLMVDTATATILVYVSIFPLFQLFWMEYVLQGALRNRPWLHPFYFTAILGVVTIIALVENSVFDFDNLQSELFNVSAIGFAYTVVVWFSGASKTVPSIHARARPSHDALSVLVYYAVFRVLLTTLAPYTTAPALNYLWLAPLVFALFGFGSSTWLQKVYEDEKRVKGESDKALAKFSHYTNNMSIIQLVLQFAVLWYYLAIHTRVDLTLISSVVFNSVQMNTTATQNWQTPVLAPVYP